MAVYKDFSEYELDNIKLHNVINIGWLGEAGSFPQGNVSEEFLMNLWEYYKCPFFRQERYIRMKTWMDIGNFLLQYLMEGK